MSVKTAKFNGVVYDIDLCGPTLGTCDYPRGGKPSIRIADEPFTKSELGTIVHEALHAEDWSKSEEIVKRVSEEISRFLWRLDYRRKKV